MKSPLRWSAAVATGITLSFGLLAPTAFAQPRPTAPVSTRAAATRSLPTPTGWVAHREAAAARLGLEPSPVTAALRRALDPGDYACGPTEFDAYIDSLLGALTAEQLQFLVDTDALSYATYDALVFGTSGDPEYALDDQAKQLSRTFRDLKRFWDVETDDIQLLAMHGEMVLDVDRVTRLLVTVYGLTPAEAAEYAQAVSQVVASIPALQGGANPLFTLNAFAFSGEGESDPLFASIPDKIIFGDGILDALDAFGLSGVGPRVVLAHEFGHHVQFELDLFDSPLTGAEATRRTELMADAFATYFAVHARGLSLNAKRVADALQTFYDVGDCGFDSPGHHGTPQQRARTAAWAASLAENARPQGKILSAATFAALFEAELPELVAPDA